MTAGNDDRTPEERPEEPPEERAGDDERTAARSAEAEQTEQTEQPTGQAEHRTGQADDTGQADGADETNEAGPAEQGAEELDEEFAEELDEELDEEALRRLMRDAVRDIEPAPDALTQLQHAVPARRARRRHTLVGAAAIAAVLIAVPSLMQAGVVPGPLGDDQRGKAAHSQDAETGGEDGDGNERPGDPEGNDPTKSGGTENGDKGKDSESPSAGSTESPGASDDLSSTSPRCARDQLGQGNAQVGTADAQGRIYGSFRLTNVSGDTCRVTSSGELVAIAQGNARASAVQVLDHTTGGRADQLPDPSEASDNLILRPGQAYQVRFAWIPDLERGAGGCSTEPDPDPSDNTGGTGGSGSDGGSGGGDTDGGADGGNEGGDEGGDGTGDSSGSGGDDQSGMSTLADSGTGSGGDNGDDGDGSGTAVVLRYTPAAGEPRAPRAHLDNVCAGTIYRTGALPVS